jgi:hypothetical protein
MPQTAEQRREYQRKYRLNNPEKIKAQKKQYYTRVKDASKTDPIKVCKSMLASSKDRSKNRGRNHAITEADIINLWTTQKGICALTGLQMSSEIGDPYLVASLDRIDSRKGYVSNNIQLVCKWVNIAKKDTSNTLAKKFFSKLVSGKML